jgi:hypothetical protein
MPGDISRKTFIPTKHYSAVLKQQGRVNTDTDDNEQVDLWQHRVHTEATDVIGPCGVPISPGGFAIGLAPGGHDLTLSPGRIYIDGLLFESEASAVPIEFVSNQPAQAVAATIIIDGRPLEPGQWVELSAAGVASPLVLQVMSVDANRVITLSGSIASLQAGSSPVLRRVITYLSQPDYPSPDFAGVGSPPTPFDILNLTDGTYIAYINGWQQEITALDDRLIREVALGGPDTGTRLKNVWQLMLLKVTPAANAAVNCDTQFTEWDIETAAPTGLLNARTQFTAASDDPCLLPPSSGFSRLENQLYRVEIHTGGFRSAATFKWSRDNAIVETRVVDISGNIVSVADTGKDEFLGFAADQWVELIDDESALNQEPRALVQIDSVDPSKKEITTKSPLPSLSGSLKLRRWDQFGAGATANGVAMTSGWIDLEGNIQVLFSDGTYQSGDFWLIPARTATGEIEWSPFEVPNSRPIPQPPIGIDHHFCRLALLTVTRGIIRVTDCRKLFPPLTEMMRPDPGIHVIRVFARDAQGQLSLLANDSNVLGTSILGGIAVECDAPIAPISISRPDCFVTMELPFERPGLAAGGGGVETYVQLALAATVGTNDRTITWAPSARARALLSNLPIIPEGDRGFLARLTLKGNFIWSLDDLNLFLDGEAFGFRALGVPLVSLRLPSGDRRKGGDFEMWFWLTRPGPVTAFSLTVSVPVPPVLRTEGVTELIGDVILAGTGGTPTAAGSPVPVFNVQVFLNATITSPAIGNGLEDAVMLIDEPVRLNTTGISPTPPPVIGAGAAGLDYRNGVAPNIFIGRRATPNSILFAGIPMDPAPGTATRTFRIKNLRINANELGTSSNAPTDAIAFVTVTGPVSVPVLNPQQIAGFINAGFTARNARTDGLPGPFSFTAQQGVNQELAIAGMSTNAVTNLTLDFTEGFASAFKVRQQGPVVPFLPQPMEEAGFDNQGTGALPIQAGGPLPSIGAVLCGTRFQALFQDVPPGVRVFVTTRDMPPAGAQAAPRAVIVPDANAPLPSEVPPVTGSETAGIPIQEVPIVAGNGVVFWEWINHAQGTEVTIEAPRFGVVLTARPGGTTVTQQPATIRLSLAPLSTDPSPTGKPIPRFVLAVRPQPAFTITGSFVVIGPVLGPLGPAPGLING